jgi:outer membrane protein assembly factor BamA
MLLTSASGGSAGSARRARWVRLCAQVILLCCSWPSAAQEPQSRAEILLQARRDKAQRLAPEKPYPAERALERLEELGLLDPNRRTVWPRIGGLPTGQGFAVGPQYFNPRLAGSHLTLRTSVTGSITQAWLADVQLTTRRIADDRVFADFLVSHLNAPRLDYYGLGPDSAKDSRTSYRLETNSASGTLGVRPFFPLSLGITAGYLTTNTGPGNRDDFPQTQQIFDAAGAPGIVDQSDFLVTGLFAQYDYRDYPSARNGGMVAARLTNYDDRTLDRHSFRRLDLEAQQYFSFFQDRRVIALRARTAMTFTSGAGQSVPFYLQPYLGGSDDLRGFRSYRFYDDHHIVVNAEYRWEAFAGMDMALFFDAGKVAPKRSQINFHDLEATAGFGFRFNARNSVFMRIDIGFSHEGMRLWFKFANPF